MKDLIIKQKQLPEKSIKYMKSVVAFANGTGGKIKMNKCRERRES